MRTVDPRWWRPSPSRARDGQLPGFALATATGLRAGLSLADALAAAAASVGAPLGPPVEDRLRPAHHGAPLAQILRAWEVDPAASDDERLLATALLLGATTGGNLAQAVDRTAATLRERHALRGEARALATQARSSALVLAVAPVAFAALMASVDRRTAGVLLGSPAGWACLTVGLTLDVVGLLWMGRITRAAT